MSHRDTEAQSPRGQSGLHFATTAHVIECAVEVHRHLGPGLLEKVYEAALCYELSLKGLAVTRQVAVPLFYKDMLISEHRPDVIVDSRVVVEVKSVTRIEPLHIAQVLTYLRVTQLRVGLILNFNTAVMTHGVKRLVL
jgi:GxxExxY protein